MLVNFPFFFLHLHKRLIVIKFLCRSRNRIVLRTGRQRQQLVTESTSHVIRRLEPRSCNCHFQRPFFSLPHRSKIITLADYSFGFSRRKIDCCGHDVKIQGLRSADSTVDIRFYQCNLILISVQLTFHLF